jgi:hypothetical protein
VLAVIAAGVAGVVALWWRDTPPISGLGDELTGAGRILGLLAGYGVVVLVALMARLPPLERGIGASRLARWHAMGANGASFVDSLPGRAPHYHRLGGRDGPRTDAGRAHPGRAAHHQGRRAAADR